MRYARSVVALVAALALVSACSSNGSTPTAGGGGGATTGAGGTSSGGGGGGGGGAPAKVTCNQLTKADVQGLMTNPVDKVTLADLGTDNDGQRCDFNDADTEQDVEVLVVPANDQALGYDSARSQATNPVDVAGVGDKAFREGDDFTPTAEHGGISCTVTISTDTQLPGFATTGGASPTYTDAQNDTLAKALGTVCNRLFGSGNTTPTFSGVWGS